jgi:hypothetical protein
MSGPSPIVAICIPSGDMVHADFATNLAALCLNPGARTGVINCKGSIVAVVRNQCVAAAQLIKATHLLFLDSDMTFPLDMMKRLLAHEKDIVGAIYSRRAAPFSPTGMPLENASPQGVLRRMKILPTGCMLITMRVFEKLPKPWFSDRVEGEKILGEDFHFCENAAAAGFEIWEDTALSKEVGHIGQRIYRLGEN